MKNRLLIFLTVLLCILLGGLGASAETSGTIGENLTWVLDDNGVLTISGTGTLYGHPWTASEVREVVINSGVTDITGWVFSSCSNLTKVTLPEGLISIGENAFLFDRALTSLHIPSTVESITGNPLGDCGSITEITVAAGNTHYTSVDGVLFTADMTRLVAFPAARTGAYTVPSSVTVIGNSAFRTSDLSAVTLPDALTTLERMAFYECLVEQMHLPAGVQTIQQDALQGSRMVYSVDDANPYYKAMDGVLYSKGGKTLVKYGRGKTDTVFNVPDGVETIGAYAFDNADRLSKITFPDTLVTIEPEGCAYLYITSLSLPEGFKTIDNSAFWCCRSISEVHLPRSLESIGSYAFGNNDSLTDVYYAGTAEEWAQVTIDPDNNEPLLNAQMHFAGEEEQPEVIASGTWGENLTWSVDSEGLLVISGEGAMADFSSFGTFEAWQEYRSSVTRVEISEGITTLGFRAFESFSALTDISLPDSLTAIGGYSINGCRSLESITIPAHVLTIGDVALSNNASLKEILVSEQNPAFSARDGALFDHDMKTLIQFPNGKDGVFTIPDGVQYIGVRAVYWSSKLTGIVIPSSITDIGANAFQSCSKLADVYYKGTQADWNQVTIGTNNAPLLNAQMHFEGGEPEVIASGTCGESLNWTLNSDGLLTVSGTGEMENYDAETPAPWTDHKASILSAVIESGVTRVGSHAFSGCENLAELTLPDTLQTIGNQAFGSTGLTAVSLPASLTRTESDAFQSCKNLTSITIDAANTSYVSADGILYTAGMMHLMICPPGISGSFTIPSGVQMIGGMAFYDCDSLTEVIIPEGVISIGTSAFAFCEKLAQITIPASMSFINGNAFEGCSALTDVYYGGTQEQWNNTMIGGENDPLTTAQKHFAGGEPEVIASGTCGEGLNWTLNSDGLLTVSGAGDMENYDTEAPAPWTDHKASILSAVIESGVTHVGSFAFSGCENLAQISLPDTLQTIGNQAFGSTGLTTVSLPASLTRTESDAFQSCKNLTSITIDAGNTSYVSADGILYTAGMMHLMICPPAFSGSFTIPSGVQMIGGMAFYDCDGLTEVIIPEGVISIGTSAFAFCEKLAQITIPASMTFINGNAFEGCSALTDVYYGGTQEQWNNTMIGGSNDPLRNAEMHYAGSDEPTLAAPTIELLDYSTAGRDVTVRITCADECDYIEGDRIYVEGSSGTITILGTNFRSAGTHTLSAYACKEITLEDGTTDWIFSETTEVTFELTEPEGGLPGVPTVVVSTLEPEYGTQAADLTIQIEGAEAYTYMDIYEEGGGYPTEVYEGDTVHPFTETSEPGLWKIWVWGRFDGVWSDSSYHEIKIQPLGVLEEPSILWNGKPVSGRHITLTPASPLTFTIVSENAEEIFYDISRVDGEFDPSLISFESKYLTWGGWSDKNSYTTLTYDFVKGTSVTLDLSDLQPEPGVYRIYAESRKAGWEYNTTAFWVHIVQVGDRILDLPADLTTIESQAFADLSSVDAVRIPATVASIADDAFSGTDIVILTPAGSYASEWAQDPNHTFTVVTE